MYPFEMNREAIKGVLHLQGSARIPRRREIATNDESVDRVKSEIPMNRMERGDAPATRT